MRYEIIRGLVSSGECNELNTWADTAANNDWLDAGITYGGAKYPKELRRTSRFYGDRFQHPALALDIFGRIRKTLGLQEAPIVSGHGRDGIVINYTSEGGIVYEHTDPRSNGLAVLRCNLLSRAPQAGGELFVEGVQYPMYEAAIHCYLVSEHKHRVEAVCGDKARVLWMFGFAINPDDWNNNKIRVGNVW